jgi:hypothetical protein
VSLHHLVGEVCLQGSRRISGALVSVLHHSTPGLRQWGMGYGVRTALPFIDRLFCFLVGKRMTHLRTKFATSGRCRSILLPLLDDTRGAAGCALYLSSQTTTGPRGHPDRNGFVVSSTKFRGNDQIFVSVNRGSTTYNRECPATNPPCRGALWAPL